MGAILSVEVSRLARQDSEGYRLVEVAALAGVLLIDEQQVYDPNNSDDRLMLGLKVLLSSNEIRLMNQRLRENKLRKAQRGELRLSLPVGLVQDSQAKVRIDPDERVQGALRLVFERFRITRHLSSVVKYFFENGLLIPHHIGNWNGPIEWSKLSLPARPQHLDQSAVRRGVCVWTHHPAGGEWIATEPSPPSAPAGSRHLESRAMGCLSRLYQPGGIRNQPGHSGLQPAARKRASARA